MLFGFNLAKKHRVHEPKAPPNVIYAQLKFMWATGLKDESLEFLRTFTDNLVRDINESAATKQQRSTVPKHKIEELSELVARCHYKQGEWQSELKSVWNKVSHPFIAYL